MFFKNHLSIFVIEKISSMDIPARKAEPKYHSLFGLFEFKILFISSLSSIKKSNPEVSVSIDLIAFPRASLKLLPIDITSPTDFICVPSSGFVCGNFSKVNLGILTTT